MYPSENSTPKKCSLSTCPNSTKQSYAYPCLCYSSRGSFSSAWIYQKSIQSIVKTFTRTNLPSPKNISSSLSQSSTKCPMNPVWRTRCLKKIKKRNLSQDKSKHSPGGLRSIQRLMSTFLSLKIPIIWGDLAKYPSICRLTENLWIHRVLENLFLSQ